MIHVCSLARLHDTVEETGARHVVTLLKDTDRVERPDGIVHARTTSSSAWTTSPSRWTATVIAREEHVDTADRLRARLGPRRAAGGALLRRHQPLDRGRLRGRLRAQSRPRRAGDRARAAPASPTATPNARIVSLADRMLGRDGRMIAAIEPIGRGEMAYEGVPFRLDLE